MSILHPPGKHSSPPRRLLRSRSFSAVARRFWLNVFRGDLKFPRATHRRRKTFINLEARRREEKNLRAEVCAHTQKDIKSLHALEQIKSQPSFLTLHTPQQPAFPRCMSKIQHTKIGAEMPSAKQKKLIFFLFTLPPLHASQHVNWAWVDLRRT